MGIEEKARAYDEALKAARKELGVDRKEWKVVEHVIRNIFPELYESEGERARKWLTNLVECLGDPADEDAKKELEEMRPLALAYLEKQKDHFRDDTKMVEQKSAENGVDVIRTSALLAADRLASAEMTGRLKERSEILENPEKYGLQKPAEWSEEDEKMLKSILWVLESYVSKDECGENPTLTATYPTYFKEIAWLKSLRPQSKEELAKMLQEEYNKGKEEGERIGHTKGYNKGYKDAEDTYNKAVSYHS